MKIIVKKAFACKGKRADAYNSNNDDDKNNNNNDVNKYDNDKDWPQLIRVIYYLRKCPKHEQNSPTKIYILLYRKLPHLHIVVRKLENAANKMEEPGSLLCLN